ncbi:MAG: hypothetical protein B7X34_08705 [Acidobacteriia bacterium 12-62-4]|nr:MAG: hypothetical protein B7X34_08705 [Acidobacteriia bacterium 12-62-4]
MQAVILFVLVYALIPVVLYRGIGGLGFPPLAALFIAVGSIPLSIFALEAGWRKRSAARRRRLDGKRDLSRA